ncbi:hypothetical protein D3C87_97580 [compost metagenome]
MKKYATILLVLMILPSANLFGQTRKETAVKLEWQEQTFIHFYTTDYSVFVSKPEFLSFNNDLLVGLFDEFADTQDSINLADPFSSFKTEQQQLLWSQLIQCATAGHMLIQPADSKKKLKNVLIVDDKSALANSGNLWECRDPKTNKVIFSHYTAYIGNQSF